MSAGAHIGEFSTVFGLFLHSLTTGIDVNIYYSRLIERIHSYSNSFTAIVSLYELSGWRPDCRQAAQEAARLFYNLPAEVIARFQDVPTPEFLLDPFIPFLEGRVTGLETPTIYRCSVKIPFPQPSRLILTNSGKQTVRSD